MTEEHKIQNQIRISLSDRCTLFRVNVGKAYTKDGRYFDTGVPKGFSDLFGFRKSDGKAVFIEVKNAYRQTIRTTEKNFSQLCGMREQSQEYAEALRKQKN